MRIVCCLALLLLVVGCAPKSKGDIIDPGRCDTVQGIMDYDELKGQGGVRKKIFCDFVNSGEMVVEDLDGSKEKVTKTEIKKDELEDIKAIFRDALEDLCPGCLAASEEEADVVVKANVVRLVGHVKGYEASGDESMIFSGGDRETKIEYQAALTVDTQINGKPSTYDHIVDVSIDRKLHVEKVYAVVAASNTHRTTTEFITKYDSIPLATGAIIFVNETQALLGINTFHFEQSGYFDIYDLSSMEVERHLDLTKDNLVWWWKEDKDASARNEIIALYSSGVGAMRYLVYDYVKNLVAEVRDAQ